MGVQGDGGKGGPLAAPFVSPEIVLHLVKPRWRTRSEIGNAEGEVRAVSDISRAASKRVDLLAVGVTALFASDRKSVV